MKKLSPILTLLVALSMAGCEAAQPAAIQASGQIEAQEIVIAPELPGRIVEAPVEAGAAIQAGEVLLRLDDSLLLSEKRAAQAALDATLASVQAAQAALDSAQAQHALALSAALAAEAPFRQEAWKQSAPEAYDQPAWYFSQAEHIQSAQAEAGAAAAALEEAQADLDDIEKRAGSAGFLDAEQKLSDARAAYEVARLVLDRASSAADGSLLRDAAQAAFDRAETSLETAQTDYADALTTEGAQDVLEARAEAAVARERSYAALDALRALQTGEYSLGVVAAGKAADQAGAGLAQAQAAVAAAQASLDLLEAQIEKLTLRAPMDGVVLIRSVEAGEIIQAGMPAMTIGKLDSLRVKVYIPETEYGQITLGQAARLSVDSFPGTAFPAVVTRISDKAEFTPQNVQTKEGRQTTVYAVELTVDNADGRLKPGMPVDVTFESGG